VHVECLMCYTCRSVDHPIPSCFSCYRLKGQFRNFAIFPRPSGSMVPVLGNTQIS
jgi:hypothetical protein